MDDKHNVLKRILSEMSGSDIPDEQVEKFYSDYKSNGLSEDLCYVKYVTTWFEKRWSN